MKRLYSEMDQYSEVEEPILRSSSPTAIRSSSPTAIRSSSPTSTPNSLEQTSPISTTPSVQIQKDTNIPKYYRRIMTFDTETSGLLPRHRPGEPYPPDEAYPYIMQISWIVFNVSTNEIEETVNEYIQIPKTVVISPESQKVHGITREVAEEKGKPIEQILAKFFISYMKCNCIVAHNLRFDSEMVRKEMWRNKTGLMAKIRNNDRVNMMCGIFTKKFNLTHHIDTYCTMMNTIKLCAIPFSPKEITLQDSSSSFGVTSFGVTSFGVTSFSKEKELSENAPAPVPAPNNRKKFPRLNELYSVLFDTPLPEDMHNSMIDVLVCLRCFLKLRNVTEMQEQTFQELVQTYSRIEINQKDDDN
jgi:DNA polymerase III epsilon subunit-like protein